MEDEALPAAVQAEVDKIRSDEGIDETAEPAPERAVVPTGPGKPLSRRQAAEQERIAQIQSASDRATRAEAMAEELRKQRDQDIEWRTRIEANLQHALSRPEPQRQEREAPAVDVGVESRKLQRQADEALAAGRLDDYHEANREIRKLEREADRREILANIPRHEPQPQKPAWVTAVESQYPDVMMHPNGLNAVAAFAQIDPTQFGPEKLKRAFDRAREEYGQGGKRKEPAGHNERRREQLAGGPVNGSTRGGGGKGEKYVNVPANYRDIARRAGMSPEAYIRSYATMNPGEISKE